MRLDTIWRLNVLKAALGVDHRDMAEITGASPSTWSNWRNPDIDAMIPPKAALRLFFAYGVTMEWLYGGELATITDAKLRQAILRAERDLQARQAS